MTYAILKKKKKHSFSLYVSHSKTSKLYKHIDHFEVCQRQALVCISSNKYQNFPPEVFLSSKNVPHQSAHNSHCHIKKKSCTFLILWLSSRTLFFFFQKYLLSGFCFLDLIVRILQIFLNYKIQNDSLPKLLQF